LRQADWTLPAAGTAIAVAGSAAALLAGLWTSTTTILAAAISLATAVHWLPAGISDHDVGLRSLCAGIVAFALFCLGPGAYSLDARLYGRREIIIPRRDAP
jgi:hypothetical protein